MPPSSNLSVYEMHPFIRKSTDLRGSNFKSKLTKIIVEIYKNRQITNKIYKIKGQFKDFKLNYGLHKRIQAAFIPKGKSLGRTQNYTILHFRKEKSYLGKSMKETFLRFQYVNSFEAFFRLWKVYRSFVENKSKSNS